MSENDNSAAAAPAGSQQQQQQQQQDAVTAESQQQLQQQQQQAHTLLQQREEIRDRRKQQRAVSLATQGSSDNKRSTKSLTADVKKNSGFIKRLRSYGELVPDQKQKMQEEAESVLNMKRYVSELVQAITTDLQQSAEQRHLIRFETAKNDDLERIASMCVSFHSYYEDFAEQLYSALLKGTRATDSAAASESATAAASAVVGSDSSLAANPSGAAIGAAAADGGGGGSDQSSASSRFFDPAKVRFALFLGSELYLVGVFRDVTNLYILLKSFIAKEGDKRALATLNVVLQWLKLFAVDFVTTAAAAAAVATAAENKEDQYVSDAEKTQFRDVLVKFFRSLCEKVQLLQQELQRAESAVSIL